MPNQVLRCIRECRLANAQGLEEHYEDEAGQDLYEVSEERAKELLETGNFETAPPGSEPHTSFVGADSGLSARVDTEHPPRFGGATGSSFGAPSSSSGGNNAPDTGLS